MTPALHLPRPRRPRLPARLLGGIPGLGKDTWTANDPTAVPAGLSLWEPVYLGVDLYGEPVWVSLAYRNLLLGGLPDAGKSNGVAQVLGHAALCPDVALWLFDGKETELARSGSHSRTASSDTTWATPSTPSLPCKPCWTRGSPR